MKKSNHKKNPISIKYDEIELLQDGYINKINSDPKYSLEIDPTNKYNWDKKKQDFIRAYIDTKNIETARILVGMTKKEAASYLLEYDVKQEIRRISLAMYHHQFASKMINLDEIGGYLTSLLTDSYMSEADQLNQKQKLNVVGLLLQVITMKHMALSEDPHVIDAVPIEKQLENLSIKSIKQLISASGANDIDDKSKEELINIINKDNLLSIEEIAALKAESIDDLKQAAAINISSINRKER